MSLVYKICEDSILPAIRQALPVLRICEKFDLEEEDIVRGLFTGRTSLFIIPSTMGWVTTEFTNNVEGEKDLWIRFAASRECKNPLKGTLDFFEQYACNNSCSSVYFYGRVGWSRVFRDYEHNTIYAKRVAHGKQETAEASDD